MKSRIIVIEAKSKCNYRCGYFVNRTDSKTTKIHLSEIYSIIVESNQVYISSYLLSELAKNKIFCIICDEKHNPIGLYLPLYGNFVASLRIQQQVLWSLPIKKNVWKKIIQHKIYNQAKVLEMLGSPSYKNLLKKVKQVKSGDSTFQEANAASIYFLSLFGVGFTRKQDNNINAALNYGYSIILSMCNREICSEGYSTLLGVYHNNQYNYFNLACDFMEPFRPIVDFFVAQNYASTFDKNFKQKLQLLPCYIVNYKDGHYQLKSVIKSFIARCFGVLNKTRKIDDILGYELVCTNQG